MNKKLAVIGEKQIVTAFKAVGLETFFADKAEDATDILRELVKSGDYAVVFITENIAASMDDTLQVLKNARILRLCLFRHSKIAAMAWLP